MRTLIVIILLAFISPGTAQAGDSNHSFTVYLVRHAEKQPDGSRDPELTKVGEQRAERLANWFSAKGIQDIWSSDYIRTRDTAKPLLAKLNLDLSIYDPGKLAALSEKLVNNQHTALVVGHSNTTPELASLLCQCEIAEMDESEYDRLIVISIGDGATRVETLRQQ
jgi:phosphohistidine phosphatase SixA